MLGLSPHWSTVLLYWPVWCGRTRANSFRVKQLSQAGPMTSASTQRNIQLRKQDGESCRTTRSPVSDTLVYWDHVKYLNDGISCYHTVCVKCLKNKRRTRSRLLVIRRHQVCPIPWWSSTTTVCPVIQHHLHTVQDTSLSRSGCKESWTKWSLLGSFLVLLVR